MDWPTPTDYQEAFQDPKHCFEDPELKSGEPFVDVLGLPKTITGSFASVCPMKCNGHTYAVKCFSFNRPEQEQRYGMIARHLDQCRLPCMVNFKFLRQGINIEGRWYPILKMEWIEGESLDVFIAKNLHNPGVISTIAEEFSKTMGQLRKASVAHGDLQHGNILISANKLRLIDYDGMYVPGLNGEKSHELGHRNYQHPKRGVDDFGTFLDNFAAWSIYLSLLAISADGSILNRLTRGDECLLFRKEDFDDPQRSKALQLLKTNSNSLVRDLACFLEELTQENSLKNIPFLDSPKFSKKTRTPAATPHGTTGHIVQSEPAQAGGADASWVWDHLPSPEPDKLVDSVKFERLFVAFISLFTLGVGLLGPLGYLALPVIISSCFASIATVGITLTLRYRKLPQFVKKSLAIKEIRDLKKQSKAIIKASKDSEKSIEEVQKQVAEMDKELDRKNSILTSEKSSAEAKADRDLDNEKKHIDRQRSLLRNQEQERIDQAFVDHKARVIHAKLTTHRIETDTVFGIGEKLIQQLNNCGIYSAADIIDVSINPPYANIKKSSGMWVKIDGIGPQKAEALIDWRRRWESRYVPSSLPRTEEEQIRRVYANKHQDLDRQYRDAKDTADRIKKDIMSNYKQKTNALRTANESLKSPVTEKEKAFKVEIESQKTKIKNLEWEISSKSHDLELFKDVTFTKYLGRVFLGRRFSGQC